MLGRAAYQNPYLLAAVDSEFFGVPQQLPSRHAIIGALLPYLESELSKGVRLTAMTRHILGLFQGQPGAKTWRRMLSENAHKPTAGVTVVEQALAATQAACAPKAVAL